MTIQTLSAESLVTRIVAELDENPDARAILLRALLTDDFLALPAKVDKIQDQMLQMQGQMVQMQGEIVQMRGQMLKMNEQIAQMQGQIAEMQGQIAEMQGEIVQMRGQMLKMQEQMVHMQEQMVQMQGDMGRMRGDIGQIQGDMARTRGDIGRLDGEKYERRMAKNVGNIALQRFNMRRIKALKWGENFQPLLDFLSDSDVVDDESISGERVADLALADIVASGIRQADRTPVHLVDEVSITIGGSDILRAAERAGVMADITGEESIAAVIGERISEPDRRRAERMNVEVTIIRD